MKMLDMGEKMEETSPVQKEGSKQRIDYPTIHLSNKIPDNLFEKEIGEECELKIIVKIVNKGIDENVEKKRKNLTLEVHQMGVVSDEKDLEEEVTRQLKKE